MSGVIRHRLALEEFGDFEALIPEDFADQASAFIVGEPRDGCIVRLQSRCLYGEVLGSADCDCRPQLELSLRRMTEEGSGVLIYLEQEGRGSGLAAKARAYALRETSGLDTFAAYGQLGLHPDERDYGPAIRLLNILGLTRIRLLTNNPRKFMALDVAGIEVEREAVIPDDVSPQAFAYLEAKRANGHWL